MPGTSKSKLPFVTTAGTEECYVRLGIAGELAETIGARCLRLEEPRADSLVELIERSGVSETREPREKRLRKRSSRERPLLIVNTGYGKGKSTASFGVMLRGWARGYRIGVYQFVKSGKWNVGEQKAAEALGNIDWFKQGDGWTWTVKDLEHSADLAREGWEEVKRRLADETYDMLLLDEFTYPMKFGWVDTNEIVEVLKNRPGFQHVIITGRDAPPELVEISDLVSEVIKVKHPFDEGYRGQKGIEW